MELKLNNYSDQLKADIDKHKPTKGNPVKFRILMGQPNPVVAEKATKPWLYPTGIIIPARDTITDPYTQELVDIAVIEGMGPDQKTPQFHGYHLQPRIMGGYFVCKVEDARSMKWFPYLWISNFNSSVETRDDSKTAMFEFVDEASEARGRIEVKQAKQKAILLLTDMDYDKLQQMSAMYPDVNGDLDKDTLYDILWDKAEADSSGFLTKATSPDLDKYVTIDRAVKKNLISYDSTTNSYKYVSGEATIVSLGRSDGKKPVDLFVDWIRTSDEGGKELQIIKDMLKTVKPKNQNKKAATDKGAE